MMMMRHPEPIMRPMILDLVTRSMEEISPLRTEKFP